MTESVKVGPLTVRPHVRNGEPSGQWFVDIPARLMPNGVRKRKIFNNRREALDAARKLARALEARAFGQPVAVKRTGILFSEAVQRWIEHEEMRVRTLKKRASSLATDQYRLRSILPVFGNRDLSAIQKKEIVDFQAMRLEAGRSPSTVNSDVITVMKIFHWAQEEGLIEKIPTVERIPETQREVDIPTQEEVGRLIAALPDLAKPVVWFMAVTGCRSGEAFNLTWDCVDEVNGWVEFRAKDGWTPKTRQSQRRIPISGELLELLRGLPKNGTHVFPSRDDPNSPRDNVRRALDGAVQRSGLMRKGQPMHLSPHVLRKAFATWQANSGTPQRLLQALLGHAPGTKVTDRHYVQATEDAKRATLCKVNLSVGT